MQQFDFFKLGSPGDIEVFISELDRQLVEINGYYCGGGGRITKDTYQLLQGAFGVIGELRAEMHRDKTDCFRLGEQIATLLMTANFFISVDYGNQIASDAYERVKVKYLQEIANSRSLISQPEGRIQA